MENIPQYVRYKDRQFSESDGTFKSLFDIIHDQGDRIFCEYFESLQAQKVSYKQFRTICFKTASYLSTKLTSTKNSFVGLYMENSVNWVATFWALLMLGYKPLLLNCKLPNSINDDIIKTMNCKEIVINNNTSIPSINASIIKYPDKEILDLCGLYQDNQWANEIAICTTASSLNWKICVYSGQEMLNQLRNAKFIIDKCPRIKKHYHHRLKLLAFLPFYHIFGLVATYLWFASFGRTIVLLNDYSADTILNTVRFFEVTHIFSVPLFWNTIAKAINAEIEKQPEKTKQKFVKAQKFSLKLQHLFPSLGLAIAKKMFKPIIEQTLGESVMFCITGGGNILDTTLKLINSIGYPLFNGYGSSENGIVLVNLDLDINQRISSCVGKPLKTYELKIEDGRLLVKGSSSAKYVVDSQGNKQLIAYNWFDTKDVASVVKDNYYINGRNDDVFVNENGEKINPDLIERKLDLSLINNYCILPYNNKLSLIIQLPNTLTKYDVEKIINEVTNNVNRLVNNGYAIQSIYYTYDQIAPTNAIKVSRRILKIWLNENKVHLKPFSTLNQIENKSDIEVNNEITNKVKEIICSILNKNINDVTNDQHLVFDLGATSIEYMTCLVRLQKEYNVNFDLVNNSCKTINEFSKYIIDYKKGGK